MKNGNDIGPDIEVAVDEFEDQQAFLAGSWQEEMEAENASEEAWAAMKEGDPLPGLNSCDALRIIDGVKPIQED